MQIQQVGLTLRSFLRPGEFSRESRQGLIDLPGQPGLFIVARWIL
jgi:hypothetical protein